MLASMRSCLSESVYPAPKFLPRVKVPAWVWEGAGLQGEESPSLVLLMSLYFLHFSTTKPSLLGSVPQSPLSCCILAFVPPLFNVWKT